MNDAIREAFESTFTKTEFHNGLTVVYFTDDEYEEVAWPVWQYAIAQGEQERKQLQDKYETSLAMIKDLSGQLSEYQKREAELQERVKELREMWTRLLTEWESDNYLHQDTCDVIDKLLIALPDNAKD
jgi:predicted  nucleic acid-binding Zn-ribbon protein